MIIEIKSVCGAVLYSSEATSLKDCLQNAINDSADLRYANLRYADLRYASLSYANLSSADLRYASLSSADLSSADLSSANLRYANLSYANLSYANLSSADLRYANLSHADLRYANLSYTDLTDHIKISLQPIQIDTLTYCVIIFDSHMKIGCEFHAISEWWNFTDEQIAKMDGPRATEFWGKWKAPIQAICAAEGRI